MKNTSYKNKQFVLLGMTFLSVAGIAGCSKVELAQSSVTLSLAMSCRKMLQIICRIRMRKS